MCGVFGCLNTNGLTDADTQRLDGVASLLTHRGPDGSAFIRTARASLGMHRLSIMDVEGGSQPFWSEDGQIGVLGNGEIYNAAELRSQLSQRGHRFHSGSDIEVVPHLYEEYGTATFDHLRGMFALSILDLNTQSLVLARDPMGEKPLSYCQVDGVFFFASEQSALVRAGVTPLEIDTDVLVDYLLYGFVPEPTSLIRGIRKVPAGHYLRVPLDTGAIDLRAYWDPLNFLDSRHVTIDELTQAVEGAVEATCIADVPVAIALSGGLDSSVVASIAARRRPDLHAFTIGYEGDVASDESASAHAFAEHLGITSTTIRLGLQDIVKTFAAVCAHRDEPVADIAGPGYEALARASREHGFPVLMNGQGGDELFWGYSWVRQHAVARAEFYRDAVEAPPRSPQALATWARTRGGLRTRRWARSLISAWGAPDLTPIPLWETQLGYPWIYDAITALTGRSPASIRPRLWDGEIETIRVPGVVTNAGLGTYLRVNGLMQMDRLTMRHSVEARTPLVDRRLVELVMSGREADGSLDLPPKAVFQDIASRILPAEVVSRPKRGFTPPVRQWIRAIATHHAEDWQEPVLSRFTDLDPSALREVLGQPVLRTGQVNQMHIRIATLELWLRALTEASTPEAGHFR